MHTNYVPTNVAGTIVPANVVGTMVISSVVPIRLVETAVPASVVGTAVQASVVESTAIARFVPSKFVETAVPTIIVETAYYWKSCQQVGVSESLIKVGGGQIAHQRKSTLRTDSHRITDQSRSFHGPGWDNIFSQTVSLIEYVVLFVRLSVRLFQLAS